MNITQSRIILVLDRLKELTTDDEDFAEIFSGDLQNLLDDIQCQDGFGTEGQLDPRGDFRDGDWSMEHIEGLDN